jgi:hypothetical protein
MKTQAEPEQIEITPEGEARVNGILHNAAGAPELKPRATRSDAGRPRLYVDLPGVKFDLAQSGGREALRAAFLHLTRAAPESERTLLNGIFADMMGLIEDRLAK